MQSSKLLPNESRFRSRKSHFELISQSTSLLRALGMEKAAAQSISCNDMTMASDNNLLLFFIYKPVCSVPKCKPPAKQWNWVWKAICRINQFAFSVLCNFSLHLTLLRRLLADSRYLWCKRLMHTLDVSSRLDYGFLLSLRIGWKMLSKNCAMNKVSGGEPFFLRNRKFTD